MFRQKTSSIVMGGREGICDASFCVMVTFYMSMLDPAIWSIIILDITVKGFFLCVCFVLMGLTFKAVDFE